MAHGKPHLPRKICVTCERPFSWRRKWAKDWDNVKYCSHRCRVHNAGRRNMVAPTA